VAAVPDGPPEPADLAVAEVPVPVPGRAMLAIGGDGGDTDSSDASR
jgi:hypothetical protein